MAEQTAQSTGTGQESDDSVVDSRYTVDRREYVAAGAATLAGVTGCLGGEEGPAEGDQVLTSTDPSPTGEPLSGDEIQTLVDIFDDNPMADAQLNSPSGEYIPRFAWKWVTEDTFIGLMFDHPEPTESSAVHYAVVGTKGLFTEESRPGPEFRHFHRPTAESWEAGHGGEGGEQGYWMTHIATTQLNYPFHDEPVTAGVDYDFFPTPIPEGNEEGHTTDFESPNGEEGSITVDKRDALLEVFSDKPMNEAQEDSPSGERQPFHVWKWISEETFLFLHWNNPEPAEADGLHYFGIGKRGQFSEDDRPADTRSHEEISDLAPDASHFHKHDAESWEAGHGAQEGSQWGYWLIHHTIQPVEYPFHDEPTDIGIDRNFFPTPLQQ
jgi:hypothetical protein